MAAIVFKFGRLVAFDEDFKSAEYQVDPFINDEYKKFRTLKKIVIFGIFDCLPCRE
jgi:hypothetical protein